jgi:hypothetical protein
MAKENLPKPSLVKPQKPESGADSGERKSITDPQRLIEAISGQGNTIWHIERATKHIRELSMMLHEAQDGGEHCDDVARGVQDLMSTYADEIGECLEYVKNLSNDANAILKAQKGGEA